MARTDIKTDNDLLGDKVALRSGHLPDKSVIRVLDCYAGYGVVWGAVQSKTNCKIKRLPIDINDDIGFHLPGNNVEYLQSMDLHVFDVIDLDAYGVPYRQLRILFDREYKGTVFVTFIQSVVGVLPRGLLLENGFTKEMVNKIPTLFFKEGWEYFKNFLALNGVDRIWHRSKERKHYLGFLLD